MAALWTRLSPASSGRRLAIARGLPAEGLDIIAEAELADRAELVALQPKVQLVLAKALILLDRIEDCNASYRQGPGVSDRPEHAI